MDNGQVDTWLAAQNEPPRRVISLDLPAGSYVISFNMRVVNQVNGLFGSRNGYCNVDGDTATFSIAGEDMDSATVNWTKASYLPTARTVEVTCRVSNGGANNSRLELMYARINAIQVNSIEIQ